MQTHTFRRLASILALPIAAAGACSESTGTVADNEMVAVRDSRPFHGDASATLVRYASGDTLFVYGTSPRGRPQIASEAIVVRVAFTGAGTYRLGEGDAVVWDLLGGDVATAAFTKNVSGTVTIDEGTRVCAPISGTLSFSAVAGTGKTRVTRVRSGRFRAQLAAIPGCPPGD